MTDSLDFPARVTASVGVVQDWIQTQEEPELLSLTYGQIKRLLHVALRADQTGIDELKAQHDDLMKHYGAPSQP